MSKMYEKLQKCVSIIREKTDFVPEVALILGSGLGEFLIFFRFYSVFISA